MELQSAKLSVGPLSPMKLLPLPMELLPPAAGDAAGVSGAGEVPDGAAIGEMVWNVDEKGLLEDVIGS